MFKKNRIILSLMSNRKFTTEEKLTLLKEASEKGVDNTTLVLNKFSDSVTRMQVLIAFRFSNYGKDIV